MMISEIVGEIYQIYYNVQEQAEQSHTEAQRGIAAISEYVYKLEANRMMARAYFDREMKERERMICVADGLLQASVDQFNPDLAALGTRMLRIVQSKSPFAF